MPRWLMASCLLLGLSAYLFAQDKEPPKKEPPKKERATPRPEKKDQQPAQPGDVIITINGKPVPARIQVVPVNPVPAPQPNPPEKKDQQPGKKD